MNYSSPPPEMALGGPMAAPAAMGSATVTPFQASVNRERAQNASKAANFALASPLPSQGGEYNGAWGTGAAAGQRAAAARAGYVADQQATVAANTVAAPGPSLESQLAMDWNTRENAKVKQAGDLAAGKNALEEKKLGIWEQQQAADRALKGKAQADEFGLKANPLGRVAMESEAGIKLKEAQAAKLGAPAADPNAYRREADAGKAKLGVITSRKAMIEKKMAGVHAALKDPAADQAAGKAALAEMEKEWKAADVEHQALVGMGGGSSAPAAQGAPNPASPAGPAQVSYPANGAEGADYAAAAAANERSVQAAQGVTQEQSLLGGLMPTAATPAAPAGSAGPTPIRLPTQPPAGAISTATANRVAPAAPEVGQATNWMNQIRGAGGTQAPLPAPTAAPASEPATPATSSVTRSLVQGMDAPAPTAAPQPVPATPGKLIGAEPPQSNYLREPKMGAQSAAPPRREDLEHTARIHGITVDEVLRRLGQAA